jgi:hypothetical protein
MKLHVDGGKLFKEIRGMKGNGTMLALVLILALTMACGSENKGGPGTEGAGFDNHSATIIGKWLLQEMIANSEFKHPHETAEKKWGNLEIYSNNTLEFYSSGTQGRWIVLNDGRIRVNSEYWGTFFLSIEGDKLIMAFPDDQTKYIYKKIQ